MDPQRTTPGEAGFSLIELIVVMTMLTVAMGAILSVVERTMRMSNDDRARSESIRSAQVELDGVVREARQAFRVNGPGADSTASKLDITVFRGGATRRIIFNCGVAHPTMTNPVTHRCTRQEMLAGGALTAPQVVIDRVRNTNVFSYDPPAGAPNHIGVTIEVPAAGERSNSFKERIRLNDGFGVRNRGLVP